MEADEEEMMRLFLKNAGKYKDITLASRRLASGKLRGISPELVGRLAGLKQVTCIIVEADGAAHKSLKAPNLNEPVIPANTSLVIPVVGIDAAGCRLTEESVFRSEVVSKLLGLPMGGIISVESIAILLTHRQGIIKGSPDRARIVPFINKVELDKDRRKARELAKIILAKGHPQIKAVVLGRAQSTEPVVEVINAG
jgi:probable selenium-dependent hydroxylase accessory protein YqeC